MTGSDIITAVFGAANKYTTEGQKARASMFAAMRKLMETEGQMFVCKDYDELEHMAREHLDYLEIRTRPDECPDPEYQRAVANGRCILPDGRDVS